MLGGKAGEMVSRRETPSQCGRVGCPAEAEGEKCNFQTQFQQFGVYSFCQHFTENPLFISNKILAIIISPVLMRLPGLITFAN